MSVFNYPLYRAAVDAQLQHIWAGIMGANVDHPLTLKYGF
jgi:hypothetical protein